MLAQTPAQEAATRAPIVTRTIAPQRKGKRVQITDAHVDFYRENGYLVVEDALSPLEIDALRMETVRICRG